MQHDRTITRRIIASAGAHEFTGAVALDADLDGSFILTTDEGERFKLNGWLFSIEMEG